MPRPRIRLIAARCGAWKGKGATLAAACHGSERPVAQHLSRAGPFRGFVERRPPSSRRRQLTTPPAAPKDSDPSPDEATDTGLDPDGAWERLEGMSLNDPKLIGAMAKMDDADPTVLAQYKRVRPARGRSCQGPGGESLWAGRPFAASPLRARACHGGAVAARRPAAPARPAPSTARARARPAAQAGSLLGRGMEREMRTWVRCYLLQLDDPYLGNLTGHKPGASAMPVHPPAAGADDALAD
jgi:hypothetical protein